MGLASGTVLKPLLQTEGIWSLVIRTDNMVTGYDLQRHSASVSLLNETRRICSFLTQQDIRNSVTYVPGVRNSLADTLSGRDAVGDYELRPEIFREATAKLHILANGARAVDAMRCRGQGEVPYAFSSVQQIPRVPQKLRQERVRAVVVVSEECRRSWWNLLQLNVE
jgi:hypothetical protein